MPDQKGKIIVIDGLDGSGKTTQAGLIHDWMAGCGIKSRVLSFPDYDDPSSTLVKMYLNGQIAGDMNEVNAYGASSFYAVDRFASYQRFWKEDYAGGTIFIANRYTTSNAVHQMTKLPKGEWDSFIAWLEDYEYAKLGLPRPDKVFYLDMQPSTSRTLILKRYGGDESKMDVHEKDLGYLESCRETALYAAEKMGWEVVTCCDGQNPLGLEDIRDMLVAKLTFLK